ncbi:MAG: T9SS type A sorting domain-containing protein [Chitinophagaceae bacterium]|nr:T9SS type A sorting domain-containing protein [Chitinophagaceae bacterium]
MVPLNVKLNTAITVFPNPFVNEFTIQQNGKNSSKTAVLTNLQGKKVMSISCVTNFQKINSESLKAGIYFLKMEDGSVFKLIKQ